MKKQIKNVLLIFTLSLLFYNFNNNNDASAIITPEETIYKFEAGDYEIDWAGYPFKTSFIKSDENTLAGRFCVNNNLNNCKDIGPITITRNGNNLIFKFLDTKCQIDANTPGDFDGTGSITSDNTYSLVVNGKDCKREYTDNKVVFRKI